jgi:hypothetical protein
MPARLAAERFAVNQPLRARSGKSRQAPAGASGRASDEAASSSVPVQRAPLIPQRRANGFGVAFDARRRERSERRFMSIYPGLLFLVVAI